MEFKRVYFLGIGGIGMSALARYFMHEGYPVAGYDRTPSHLTDELKAEGASIHFQDDVRLIPADFLHSEGTMVVYTPAVPQDHSEYRYFKEGGFEIVKRSQMLGHLSQGKYVMAVAGTHGKTTTSTLVAWLNKVLTGGGSAFLGVFRRISRVIWCWARDEGWQSRRMSSTARSCVCTPTWRSLPLPMPTIWISMGHTKRLRRRSSS